MAAGCRLSSPSSLAERLSPSPRCCKTSARSVQSSCRFVPLRARMDFDIANFMVANENLDTDLSPSKGKYKKHLAGKLLTDSNGIERPSRILSFATKPQRASDGLEKDNRFIYTQNLQSSASTRNKAFRHIPQVPERTLDAPELLDDYYLHLLDWSSSNDVAIALANRVYLWHASEGSIEELMHVSQTEGPVTSVSWGPDGRYIAIGLNSAEVELWDAVALRKVRSMKGHTARVGNLAWNGGPILSSGGRDTAVFNHDVRIADHLIAKMAAHDQEICGLKWSLSGQHLATGGNDNLLHIWDASMMSSSSPPFLHCMDEHRAAVRALAWCPFQSNLLASGGGTSDHSIKFWNTHTGACLSTVDAKSQVCALQWSLHDRELLSAHGFSQNLLCLWKYPSLVKMAELTGHTARVLHLAKSPDGCRVASAGGDEALRVWKLFGNSEGRPNLAAKIKANKGSPFRSITRVR